MDDMQLQKACGSIANDSRGQGDGFPLGGWAARGVEEAEGLRLSAVPSDPFGHPQSRVLCLRPGLTCPFCRPLLGAPDSDGFGPLLLPFPSLPQAPCNSAHVGRALLCTKPQ